MVGYSYSLSSYIYYINGGVMNNHYTQGDPDHVIGLAEETIPTDEELDSGRYKKLYVFHTDLTEYRVKGWKEHPGQNYPHIQCPSGGFMCFMYRERE